MANPFPISAILVASLTFVPPMPAVASQPAEEAASVAVEQLADTTLTVVPQVPYERAVLRVAGPDGYALTKAFDGTGPITTDLLVEAEPSAAGEQNAAETVTTERDAPMTRLSDGKYNYEVVFTDTVGGRQAHGGIFFVEGGSPIPREAARAAASDRQALPAGSDGVSAGGGGTPLTEVDDFLRINDTADDGMTRLLLESDYPTLANWYILNILGDLRFQDFNGVNNPFRMVVTTGGNVGIGTEAPQRNLHVRNSGGTPQLRLSRLGSSWSADLWLGNVGFWVQVADKSVVKLSHSATSNALVVDGAGIGIGTGSPAADLDIHNITGSANTAFQLTNGGNTWSATNAASGNFFFSKIGSGGQELTVRERNHAVATLDVQGHVRGTSFISTSSRTLKTAFEAVEPLDVLGKLAALPISAWRYRTESEGQRHVGPVAEDFQRLFGLGDGKTIATVDADGVMMAAIQGLLQKVDLALAAKNAEIAALEADVELLKESIADR